MTRTIQDLTPADLHELAKVLSLPPDTSLDEAWLQEQVRRISDLPHTLQNPSSFLSRLAIPLPISRKTAACLCPFHKSLNPYLIHQAFLLIGAECTTRLTRLEEKSAFLPPRISEFLNRLHGINSLWMAPNLFFLAFGEVPLDNGRRERIASGCEGCILAVIGGDDMLLSDLRAALIGRKKRNQPDAELLPLVDAWIGLNPRSEEVFHRSNQLGVEILSCRREMQKARRRERRGRGGVIDWKSLPGTAMLAFDSPRDDGDEEHNPPDSIPDCSTDKLSSTSIVSDDIHPSLVPRRSSRTSAYSDSIYSNTSDTVSPSSRDPGVTHAEEKVEEYAEKYRGLIVLLEEDEEAAII
jgi:hypothetical protein